MGNTSYAQNFEDVMLWRALGHIGNGRYIDIGAQDPLVDSVSLLFYQQGWRGVNVEPTPYYADKLRGARADEVVIQAAVTDKPGIVNFYEIPNTGLSTAEREIAEQHSRGGFGVREILVAGVTLDDIFSRVSDEVHWLKIDVEGGELQVLKGWERSNVRPWIVLIESTLPLSRVESYGRWEALIFRKGYKFAYFDGLNRFYVADGHGDLLNAFACGPNVFDHFALSGTASSDLCSDLNNRIRMLEDRYQRASHAQAVELAALNEQLVLAKNREREHHEDRQGLVAKIVATDKEIIRISELLANHERVNSQLRDSQHQMEIKLAAFAHREEVLAQQLTAATKQAEEEARSKNRELNQVRAESARLYRELTQRLGEQDALAETLRQNSADMQERHNAQTSTYLNQLTTTRDHLLAMSVRFADIGRNGLRRHLHARFASVTAHTNAELNIRTREHLSKVSKLIMDAPPFTRTNYQPPFIVNSDGVYRLEDFLTHYDLSFVRAAYAAILRREPDPEGLAHYLYQVRAGEHRAKILDQILHSDEARPFKTEVRGLSTYLKIAKACDLPILGQIVSAFMFLASVNGHMRDLRVLENHTIRIAEEAQQVNESNLEKLRSQIK